MKINMLAPNLFDVKDWMAQNIRGGENLSPDAHSSVANFTLMWNLFESTLCKNRASVSAFEKILEHLQPSQLSHATIQALDASLAFWRFRYRTPDGFGHRFDGLNFRTNDKRAHVEAVLQGTKIDHREKLLALMIIIYRLRNNLFHGLKSLDMLNDQVLNLVNASRCLAAILEAIPSNFASVFRHQAVNQ